MTYTAKTFNLPALEGLSEKQIKVHLALYEGYVKHVNLIMSMSKMYGKTEDEGGKYSLAEFRRRFAFEFNGMRLHEYYFEQFLQQNVGSDAEGEKGGNPESGLAKAAAEKYGSGEEFIAHIRSIASSRGIGWVIVYADPHANTIHTTFVNDHEVGQLAGLPILLALDLWEHAYMVDYVPADKKNYIDAFFANLNWTVVEKRFDEAMKMSAA
jgi:superoxide dismutase, Fe-Mn family